LKLANDWYWASEDDSGPDAVLDPEGYGSGTRNDLKYITAKLQKEVGLLISMTNMILQ
jgi:hypothetical protein